MSYSSLSLFFFENTEERGENMAFYGTLSSIMSKNNLSAYRVSKDTGIPETTLSRWKNTNQRPSADNMIKLYTYLLRFEPDLKFPDLCGEEGR